ncbi:MAG: DUF4982 domain-containing protein [Phycisphaerales bacterium]|nr:MAG: DUF4982 domain-containing protein [Phycisphaerales bacterium]
MNNALRVGCVLVMLLAANLCAQRTEEDFNRDWRFARGQQDESVIQMAFDDSRWQAVRVPHDWAISGPFNPRENGYAGKLPWRGVGWYRKTFKLDEADAGRRVYFDFDGVMAFPKVYINGRLAGQWDYGYMSFRVDATPYVKFGRANMIAVQADTERWGTRWYPGAGIYRAVTMTICDSVHVAHWGTYVTTPHVGDDAATVRVRSTIDNHLNVGVDVTVEVTLLDPKGKSVAKGEEIETARAGRLCEVDQTFKVRKPKRWDVTSPNLYVAKTVVRVKGEVVDETETSFGIRTFKFTADDGFHLNGRRVQLYGVNLHHDHGPLGAAFYRRAMERQLEIMKEMGVNALRTSHNPPAPEVLDLCDRMGIVVWDEAFDKWDRTAGRQRGEPPLNEFAERQLRNLVMRDRNSPSVVLWSIGNEIGTGREGVTPERVEFMRKVVRRYDPTRPVGMGCHIPGMVIEPNFDALDLTGWNYARRYANYREKYPNHPIIYSESASTLSTRGFYAFPPPTTKTDYAGDDLQVSSYDLNAAAWSDIPDAEFKLMTDDSFVAGEFVWTGFDYLGEPTPFSQEARSSYFGIVDLCGIPKDRFYLYRSQWRPDEKTIHILPHWNWPGRVGQNVPVFVYTNGDAAELFLNGKSLGRREKGVIPQRPPNFAKGKAVTASSSQDDHAAAQVTDSDRSTRWCATEDGVDQWLQIDLGETRSIGCLALEFEREEKLYGYDIRVSDDASTWRTIVTKATSRQPRWGGPKRIFHDADAQGRYVRTEFKQMRENAWASICEFGVYPERVESDYYDVTYSYRLRWNDVAYEPGQLKAVAYKGRKKIGTAVMRTAGEPVKLRLTPDRKRLVTTGEDLSYILVEAADKKGDLCPLADNTVQFEVQGPAEIAGIGNGNPLSLEPFQARSHKLFYGKAMLIIRSLEGRRGSIRVTAHSAGLEEAKVRLRTRRP